MDYSKWLRYRSQSTIIKDTDLMPEEEYITTDLYKKCFAPFHIYYSVDMSITDGKNLLGILQLYRKKSEGDFNKEDIFFLQLINDHLNARFIKEKKSHESESTIQPAFIYISKYNLTAREAEILQLIFDGYSNDKIVEKLYISHNTLKKHLQNLYRKTNTINRIQLQLLQKTQSI